MMNPASARLLASAIALMLVAGMPALASAESGGPQEFSGILASVPLSAERHTARDQQRASTPNPRQQATPSK
jgi:hypothetical protein